MSVPDRCIIYLLISAQRQCHDTRVTDAFYDSLDGLLQDLRTVTMVRISVNANANVNASDPRAGQPGCGGVPQARVQVRGTRLLRWYVRLNCWSVHV